MRHNRDVLFYIETEVQFESLKPLLEHFKSSTSLTYDIIVPGVKPGATNNEIYDTCANAILNSGFLVERNIGETTLPIAIANTDYKVLLTAYMYEWQYENINARYRIMFPYASYYFNKPHWTIGRFISQDYLADALLSHAIGTKQVTDIFTKTYIVPSLKLMGFTRSKQKKGKPILFYAPTYDEIGFSEKFLEDIENIKKKYTVIMRGHHRAAHISDNKKILENLYENADKVYDASEYSVISPLQHADVVVSDNSAIIFDAIYCGVPVCLFNSDPNLFRYKDINTAQYDLVASGDVLWTDNPMKILAITDETLTEKRRKRQNSVRNKLFPEDKKNPVSQWIDVLTIYIDDKLPHEYILAKKYWINEILGNKKEIATLKAKIGMHEYSIYNEMNPGIRTAARRLMRAMLYKLKIMKRNV